MKRSNIKGWLFAGLCLLLPLCVWAQSSTQPTRAFDSDRLEEFREQRRFIYAEEPPPSDMENWLQRVLFYLWRNLSLVFYGEADPEFTVIFYIVLTAILVFAIYRLAGVDARGIFLSRKNTDIDYLVEEEDIHQINFEAEIAEARDRQEYRKAIRLTYLYSIKLLSDAALIQFVPGKTNYEYQQELASETELAAPFQRLSRIFAYAWYGNFGVQAEDAKEAYEHLHPLLKMRGEVVHEK
ncbi:MAG: DUF4129 domain-containing protein [Bacteroidota bacterium]